MPLSEADEYRLKWVRSKPCMCCTIEDIQQPLPTEAHHLVDRGNRKVSGGHQSTIPLCRWHHRGICDQGYTSSEMLFEFGPSLALHKKRFIETYGTERDLLSRFNEGYQHNGTTLF